MAITYTVKLSKDTKGRSCLDEIDSRNTTQKISGYSYISSYNTARKVQVFIITAKDFKEVEKAKKKILDLNTSS